MTPSTPIDLVDSINPAEAELHALFHGAGVAPLEDVGWIRVTGEDRVRWLNGMVTNSIQDLKTGDGCYNFILNAQGRIQGTATAFAEPESILLQTDRGQIAPLMATLDRFIIMDDVELADVTESWAGLTLIGPNASALLAAIDLKTGAADALALTEMTWRTASISLLHAHSPVVSRFEVWTDAATSANLLEALTVAGAEPVTAEALEALRILEGTPRYGIDIRDKELPQETAQARALHFAKGCYLGQEIVERIRSRGNVHRTFAAFAIKGSLPSAGSPIESEGKAIGELTSVAAIPLPGSTLQIGLGYIRREALERAGILTSAGASLTSIPLPIRIS